MKRALPPQTTPPAGRDFHIFACGATGTGCLHMVRSALASEAARRPVADDWCYVYNFKQEHQPKVLRLPAGRGVLARLVETLRVALPAAFSRDENRRRLEDIEGQFRERQHQALTARHERALAAGILMIETPSGFTFAPKAEDGEPLNPVKFQQLPENEQKRIKELVEALQIELQNTVRQFPIWFTEMRERLKTLQREIAEFVVMHSIADAQAHYAELPEVEQYLADLSIDLIDNAAAFMPQNPANTEGAPGIEGTHGFTRYAINLIVDNNGCRTAPMVF